MTGVQTCALPILSTGVDPRQFCRQMVDYLRAVLLLHAAGADLPLDLTGEQKKLMLAQAGRADREQLIAAIKAFNEAALTPAANWQPQLPLELAFIALLPVETADRPETGDRRPENQTTDDGPQTAVSRSRSQRDNRNGIMPTYVLPGAALTAHIGDNRLAGRPVAPGRVPL